MDQESESTSVELIDRLRRYVSGGSDLDPNEVFFYWFQGALSDYWSTSSTSSFAPCKSAFDLRLGFAGAVHNFLDLEVKTSKELSVGKTQVEISRVLKSVLSSVLNDPVPHLRLNDGAGLDHFIFEIFEALFLTDPEAAMEWGCEVVLPKSGLSRVLGPGGDPFALELYVRINSRTGISGQLGNFTRLLLEWCDRVKEDFEVIGTASSLLVPVLSAMRKDESPDGQIGLIEEFLSSDAVGFDLISRIEIWMEDIDVNLNANSLQTTAAELSEALSPTLRTKVRDFSDARLRPWRGSKLLQIALSKELQRPVRRSAVSKVFSGAIGGLFENVGGSESELSGIGGNSYV